MRNIKFVSNSRFTTAIGAAIAASISTQRPIMRGSGRISPAAKSMTGYAASRMCTLVECRNMKFAAGSDVHVGNSSAAVAAGMQIK